MPVIEIDPALYKRVEQIAQWKHQQTDVLARQAIEDYLDRLEWTKLQAELQAFEAQREQLLTTYRDQYVAIHEGRVIDHDTDLRALHSRVYRAVEDVPVLIKLVSDMPEREFRIGSPRLERP